MTSKEYTARPRSSDDAKKDMWSSMLDSVASGRRLPDKLVLVLGGNSETQQEFLEALYQTTAGSKRLDYDNRKPPPVANQFALGYTYHDVFDADHEDILARLSLYLLSEPSSDFMPLIKPLLTPYIIPNSVIIILLDWSQPWSWLRQLRGWIRLLRQLLVSLDDESKETMQEVMLDWRDRGRGSSAFEGGTGGSNGADGDVALPLGPGEWDEALGIPICVVCQNTEKMDTLEKQHGWKDDEFDFVLLFLRTVLLKHGGSLIYTSSAFPGSLQPLIHSMLGIRSLVKRNPLKHNVVDRDRILVPPKWDSWGKIRVLRDNFDVEAVNTGWTIDIQSSNGQLNAEQSNKANSHADSQVGSNDIEQNEEGSAVQIFESTIQSPTADPSAAFQKSASNAIEVESMDTQKFLAAQLEILQALRAEDSAAMAAAGTTVGGLSSDSRTGKQALSHQGLESGSRDRDNFDDSRGRLVNEHIGPVQTNVGGISMNADDMLQHIMDREANRTPEREREEPSSVGSPEGKSQNEQLASFFAGLMNRGGKNSPKVSQS